MTAQDYDLQLRRCEREIGDPITRSLDLDEGPETDAALGLLLRASIRRTGGNEQDLAEYDLQIREHGTRRVIRTYATWTMP